MVVAMTLFFFSSPLATMTVHGFSPSVAMSSSRTLNQSPNAKLNLARLKSNNHRRRRFLPTSLFVIKSSSDKNDSSSLNRSSSAVEESTIYTPLNRPLLAVIDIISLIIFAVIGKSSHNTNGDPDVVAVLMTAFPFVTAWLSTSPVTNVYSPDDTSDDSNVLVSTAKKIIKGWAVAVPLGIALRGVIKGYFPPISFIIVTLISTFIILVVVRVLFAILEDVFVEIVN